MTPLNKQTVFKKRGEEGKKETKKKLAPVLVLHLGPVRDANDAP